MQGEIYLEGSVGMAFWPDEPHFTAAMVREKLSGMGDTRIYLNSGGGVASEGLAIYHLLKDHPGQVEVIVTGVAVSAASLIAMAGDSILMCDGAMMMIHDPACGWTEGRGTEDEHRAIAEMLRKQSEGYAEIYASRAGIEPEAAREIMRAETWYSADEAVSAGFADGRFVNEVVQSAASFPYRVYANAPQQLLSGCRADGPTKRAVLAMMRGAAAPTPKEAKMPKSKTPAARMAEEEDQTTDPSMIDGEEDETEDPDQMPGDGEEGDPENEDTGEGTEEDDTDEEEDGDAVAVLDLVAMHGGTVATAREFIAQRTPLAAVVAHYREKGPSVTKHKPGGATARITRDERETRRIGMTEALAAQLGRRKPTDDRARAYMSLSLAEMAAVAQGYRGPLRTAHDRIQVFMNTHTTSDFPLALSNALNKVLADRYLNATPIYRQLAREKSFKDFREHSIVRPGDFPQLQKISEAGEIKFGTIGESAETVALVSYGVGFRITRQVLINDDIGAIADAIADQGRSVARFEEKTFFASCFSDSGNGPNLSNGRAVFNTTDKTKAASGAAISVATISAGRAAIRKHLTLSGQPLDVQPKMLLTSPDTETTAEQVVAPLVPADADKANPFSGKLTPLSTAQLTGNGWYLLPDPGDVPLFIYGYLEGASAPRMRMDEPFGSQGMAWTVEHDFAAGPADRIGGWFNPGA